MCSRADSKLVRKVIDFKWGPILQKYKARMSLQCPFHPDRDMFRFKYAAKTCKKLRLWSCPACGKLFTNENHFEAHYERRHLSSEYLEEDAVCLSDYCDIIRCEVFSSQELKSREQLFSTLTDIEAWKGPLFSSSNKVHMMFKEVSPQRETKNFQNIAHPMQTANWQSALDVHKPSTLDFKEQKEDSSRASKLKCKTNYFHTIPQENGPTKELLAQSRKLRCMQEELFIVKERCESLVRICMIDSFLRLSNKDFIDLEDELKQAVCSYLTCDKYWNHQISDGLFIPWGVIACGVLCISVGVCVLYYFLWKIFGSKKIKISYGGTSFYESSNENSSGAHLNAEHFAEGRNIAAMYNTHIATPISGHNLKDHFIFVTYPSSQERSLEATNK